MVWNCLALYSFNRPIYGIVFSRIKNLSLTKIIAVFDDADTKNKDGNICDIWL